MARLFLKHITSFSYSNYVVESSNQIMLYPYNDFKQQVINHSINVTGNPTIHTSYDCYNNKVGFFNFSPPHNQMTIESQAEISVNKIELPMDKMKIADGVEYKVPPTIDDPAILTEIKEDLINHKILNNG